MNDFQRHLALRDADDEKIVVRKVHIDIAGDLVSGILLSQIVYWHLPSKRSESRLRIQRDGRYWLARKDKDWWDELRLTADQVRRARKVLSDKKIIECRNFKFGGTPQLHYAINQEQYLKAYESAIASEFAKAMEPETASDLGSSPNPPGLQPETDLGSSPNPPGLQPNSLYTKTTTETTTESTTSLSVPGVEKKPSDHRTLMDQWYKYFNTLHGMKPQQNEASRGAADLKKLMGMFSRAQIENMMDHLFWICAFPKPNETYFVRRGFKFATLLAHWESFPRDTGMDIDEITKREAANGGGRKYEEAGASHVA